MKTWLQVAAIGLCLGVFPAFAPAQAPTTTTLSVTFGGSPVTTVNPGTAVTLRATINSGSTPVTPGQVDFCDASVSWCTDVHLLGMAQLTASGTATLKYVPSIGVHQIKAVFLGTNADAASTSSVSTLAVVGTRLGWSAATPYNFVVLPTDSTPQAAVIADFNDDGKPDLAVALGGTTTPADVFLGNGDGTFQDAVAVASTNASAGSIVAGDFNSDGEQDLAITLPDVNQIQILLGNGDGTFTLGQNIQDASRPFAIATGDFNGDGIADLVIVNSNTNNLVILLGKGDGTFTQELQSPTFTQSPVSVAVGDFNGDGKADLAVVQTTDSVDPGVVTILVGNGDGTFIPETQTLATAPSPTSIATADFTGNGILDLAVVSLSSPIVPSTIIVFKCTGSGTFTAIPDVFAPVAYNFVNFGDVQNTGVVDLFVAGANGVTAYFDQQDNGLFDYGGSGWGGTAGSPFVAVGDFNGDGFADVAAVNDSPNAVVVYTSGAYGAATQIATTTTLTALPTSLTAGQTLTLTATVTAASGLTPTGTVFFLNGINILGVASLNANGVATLTLQPVAGAYSITASYTGSSTDAPSVSEPPIAVNVGSLVSTSTSIQASSTNMSIGQSVTLTATVTATGGGIPSGTVTFFNGSAPVGTGTLTAQGVATIQTTLLPAGANSITAVYPGGGTFASSTSPPLVINVNTNATTTVLQASATTLTVGQTLTLTATVTASTGGTPAGSVTFLNGGASLGMVTLNGSGVATLTLTPAAGSYSITASYGGSLTDGSSVSSPPIAVTVNQIATTTALQASATTLNVGQPLTLTATVSGASGGTPAGTVTFFNGTASLGTAPLNGSGVATLTLMPAAGSYSIAASYGGSTTDAPSTASPPIAVTVNQIATTTALQASGTTLNAGQTLTLTATVTGSSGGVPAGTVTFFNGTASLGTVTLNGSGVATLTLTPPVGSYSVTASYSGSTTDASSASSPPITVTVSQIATTTALQASATSLDLGQMLTLTATVTASSGAAHTGTVTFLNSGTALGTATLNASGVATLTITPAVGSYSITASYSGSATDASSASSPPVQVTVTTIPTTTILVANSASLTVTQPLTLTATVTATSGTTPTGTVTFLMNGTSLGTATLNANGVATLTLTPAIGSYVLSAAYSGSTSDASSTSNQVDVTVSAAATTTVLTASPNPATLGQTVTLNATVTSGIGAPGGTISFYDGGTLLGQSPVASGTATFTTSNLSLGSHSLTAVYSGATDFVPSTSAAVNEVINPPNFSISVAPSSQSVYTGESASYTVTFTQASGISLPVLLSCSQLPANTTCAFSPASMTQSGTSALTVQTDAPKGQSSARMIRTGAGAALACLFLFVVPRRRRKTSLLLSVAAGFLACGTLITGCSGPLTLGGGTPVGAQTITVTATMTDGSQQFTQSATATLNVKSLY